MIVEKGKYFLYRHIRKDKNVPFYIGIGTKTKTIRNFRSDKSEYHRAYVKHFSDIYEKIYRKSEVVIEILLESDDYQFIKNKEEEFIKLYGRINNGTGILSNLTNGGEGNKGYVSSAETKIKISECNIFKNKFGKDNPKSKKVYQYDYDGNFIKCWESLADVGRSFDKNCTRTPSLDKNRFKGYQWFYEYKGKKIRSVNRLKGLRNRLRKISVSIYQYDSNMNLLNSYKSITEAFKVTGVSITGIHAAINRDNKFCKGFYWSVKKLKN